MSTLYAKAENLWQTLNAVAILFAKGQVMDPETLKILEDCREVNNPTQHLDDTIITFPRLRPAHYNVQVSELVMGGRPSLKHNFTVVVSSPGAGNPRPNQITIEKP